MLDIYVGILTQLLVEELYPATVADLQYKLEPSEKGVVLKLNGYNEKIKVRFVKKILWFLKQKLINCIEIIFAARRWSNYENDEELQGQIDGKFILSCYWTIEKVVLQQITEARKACQVSYLFFTYFFFNKQ